MGDESTEPNDASDANLPGIAFVELREGRCKFPIGGFNDPPDRFCGEPTPPGSPYCPSCQKKAYNRPERHR